VPKYIVYQILIFGYYWFNIYIFDQHELFTPNANDYAYYDIPTRDSIQTERLVFYNSENLFHPSDDTIKADEDFTPTGQYHWTYNRYHAKINKLGKLFVAIGDGRMPAIIGLCEIENRKVLRDILDKSILKAYPYKIIHKESPDARGIDVALLYDPVKFIPKKYDFIEIKTNEFPDLKTRDILYVSGIFNQDVNCHIFVNHWPSRRGGKMASDKKRMAVARVLRQFVDSCCLKDVGSNIIIMGDFNDEPRDQSLEQILGAGDPDEVNSSCLLLNLMYPHHKKGKGTYFRVNNFTEASVLDQIIVSKAIFYGENRIKIKDGQAIIYQNEFLINKKSGRPLRTFQGLKYLGGYSDHLPVFTDIQIIN
jgi:hypothetical protein